MQEILIKFDKYIYYAICLFALVLCFSLPVGNFFLGLATLLGLIYYFKERKSISSVAYTDYQKAIGIFMLTMLLSAVFSGDLSHGLERFVDHHVYRLMPLLLILYFIKEQERIKRIFHLLLFSYGLVSCYIVFQGLSGTVRPKGFLGSVMTYAGWSCLLLPILLILILDNETKTKIKECAFVCFAVSCVAMIFNATRGAWLAMLIVLPLVALPYLLASKKKMLAFFVAMVVGLGVCTQSPIIVSRFQSISDTKNAGGDRYLLWDSAYRMWSDNKIFGVGLGKFSKVYNEEYKSPQAKEQLEHAHNNFLQMAAESGTVGLLGFIAMFGYFIYDSFRSWRKNRSPYDLMLLGSIAGLLLQGLTEYNFGNSVVIKMFWLLLGCCLILRKNQKE